MRTTIIFFFCVICVYAQSKKTVYGNFVHDNIVYQYQCTKDNGLYKFSVSDMEEDLNVKTIDTNELKRIKNTHNNDTTFINRININSNVDILIKHICSNVKQEIFNQEDVARNNSIIKKLTEKNTDKKFDSLISIFEKYKIILKNVKVSNGPSERITQNLEINSFRENFKYAFQQLKKDDTKKSNDAYDSIADEIFYSIKSKLEFIDDEPATAYLLLKRKNINIEFHDVEGNPVNVPCKVDNISVEFYEGTIKNIFIDVIPKDSTYHSIFGNQSIRFRNNMPISISSKFDPDKFQEHSIFVSNSRDIQTILSKWKYYNVEIDYKSAINLGEIIDIKVIADNEKEDYSPANGVVELNELKTNIQLKKEKRSKLLTAIAFTDIVGLNANNQNGLVQLEVKRRMNLFTKKRNGFFGLGDRGRSYTGWCNFFIPTLSINKIESNNKYLQLRKLNIDTSLSLKDSTSHFNINPILLNQYRTFNFQGSLNVFNWNAPNWKLSLHFNYNAAYSNTSLSDSISVSKVRKTNNSGDSLKITRLANQNITRVSTFCHGPELFLEYKPESRLGMTVGFGLMNQMILNDFYKVEKKYNKSICGYDIFRFYAIGFLKTNDESKLFFRFGYNQSIGNRGNNFYQMQLGYIVDLFTGAK